MQLRRYSPLTSSGVTFQIFNVYFKSGGDFSFNSTLLHAMLSVDSSIPTFLCGDLNFIEDSTDTTSTTPLLPPSSFISLWEALKSKFSLHDPVHHAHTFYHITSDPTSPYSWSSRLDRILSPHSLSCHPVVSPSVSIPFHHTNLKVAPSTVPTSFSDHLPIHLTYEGPGDVGTRSPTIPTWVASTPEFATNLNTFWASKPHPGGAYKVFADFKKVLFLAAKVTRENKIASHSAPLSLSQHLSLLRHINTTPQNISKISSLLFLAPSLSPLVLWRESSFFDNGLLDATLNLIAVVEPAPRPAANAVKVLASKAPSTKTCVGPLKATPKSTEARTDSDRSQVASDFWSKVWAKRDNPPSKVICRDFLSSYTKVVDPSLLHNVTLSDVTEAIKRSNNSSPGPDGISFAAWRAAPELAAPVLFGVYQALCSGQPPPPDFNVGLLFLLPKKQTGLISDTRPLSVTNSDNRILAAAVARAIMPTVLALFDPSEEFPRGSFWCRPHHRH